MDLKYECGECDVAITQETNAKLGIYLECVDGKWYLCESPRAELNLEQIQF